MALFRLILERIHLQQDIAHAYAMIGRTAQGVAPLLFELEILPLERRNVASDRVQDREDSPLSRL